MALSKFKYGLYLFEKSKKFDITALSAIRKKKDSEPPMIGCRVEVKYKSRFHSAYLMAKGGMYTKTTKPVTLDQFIIESIYATYMRGSKSVFRKFHNT